MNVRRSECHRHSFVSIVFLCFLVVGTLFAGKSALAQANAGITGTVTDQTGAVVPDANVTIRNEGTSVSSNTVTTGAGTYSFTGLTPGTYDVTVEKGGFKKSVQNKVNVEVTVMSTINFTLANGAQTETVEITANSIALNTTAPQLGSTIEPEVVASLPNEVSGRGRQIDQLQFLAPGTTGSAFSHRIGGGVDFEQEILYNGIPAPQPETEGYTTNFNPPFEMVSEFRVERSTFAAQFGLGQGALTYQMASGTNKFHGDLFEINRNSLFDSAGFFNNKYWTSHPGVPTDHENNYGFTVGGPVWIPKVYNGRDKTFFHYSQEWYKQNQESTDANTVPTAREKSGDFGDFVDSSGKLIPIFDPQTGQQFPGNVIPTSRFSANSAQLLQYLPDPDRPGLDSNRSYAPFINPHIQHVWGFTIDQNLNARQSLHYSQWRNTFSNYSFDGCSPCRDFVLAPNPLNSQKYEPAKGSGFLLTYNNSLTANLVMTAGIGWIGEINNQFNQTKFSSPAVQQGVIPPNITFDGSHPPSNWGTDGAWVQSINRKLGIAIVNNWLWSKGRNTFNIGGEFRRSYQDDNEEQTAGGRFQFSQRQTADPSNPGSTGSAFASYLLGLPDSANRSNSQELRLRNFVLSPYVQDDIKITPKLTLNVGLRWDVQVPFTENNNLVVFFDPNRPGSNPQAGGPGASGIAGGASKLGSCAGCAGYNRADIHWGHLGPRLGVAYQISDKTVIQAGFSIAFLNGGAYEYGTNKVAVNYGNLLVGSFQRNSTGSNVSSFGNWDANQLPNPAATPFSASLGVGNQINAFSRNDGYAPYSQQWNLNLQHELPWNVFVQAAWVANRVIHLPSNLNSINQLNPSYLAKYGGVLSGCPNNVGNSVLTDTFADGCAQSDGFSLPYANFVNDFGGSATVAQSLVPYPQYSKIQNNFEGSGTTYYQSVQLQAEKRFTNGLSFLAGYTLSRLMDNTSSGFSSFTAGGINKYNQGAEWAVSTSDEPQTLKLSGTYALPIGPGKAHLNNHGVTGQLLGGWQVGWILDYESGTAFGVTEQGIPFPNGFNRPDRAAGVSLKTTSASSQKKALFHYDPNNPQYPKVFNTNAFTATSTYVLGNAKRAYPELRNPAQYNENASVIKHFYFGDRFQGILRVDYFNLFNRTILQGPSTNDQTFGNSTFGQASNLSANNQLGPTNRQGQVQFRIEF